MKKLAAVLLAGGLLAGALAPASAKTAPLWEDAAGDADAGQGLGSSIPAGLDLASGTIEAKGKNVTFTVTHHDMPPTGSLPEAARFMWGFTVGAENLRWTMKSADIGKPDLLGGQTDERIGRVDATGHFRLEGSCESEVVGALNAINCDPLGYYEGTIDAATMSMSVTVPLKDIKAKPGSVILPGGGDAIAICQICWVSHVAERSLNSTIIDSATQTAGYKIPKK